MASADEQQMNAYADKLRQADKEAKATVVALALTVLVWILGGFGLAQFDVQIFSTPLWILGGTVGVWLFAIGATLVLGKRVFKDFDLGEEAEDE